MLIDSKTVESNYTRMQNNRTAFDSLWGEIASLVFPRQDKDFHSSGAGKFDNFRTPEATMHDPYAAQALEDGVSAFEGFVMPRGQRWQKLQLGDDELMRKQSVREWLEKVEVRLFDLRHDPMSGFAGAVHESAMSLFAFGAQSLWVEPRRNRSTGKLAGLSYQSEFIGDIYMDCDAEGYPMRIYRRLMLTAEQAALKWSERLPPKVAEAAASDQKKKTEFEFIHVIEPNMNVRPGRLDAAGKAWLAGYYSRADKAMFIEGGYDSLPRTVSRFARAPHSDWGYSPTMTVLQMIRQLQQMTIDRTVAAEISLKPSILAVDDELDGAILEMRPYGITYGGLDDNKRANFQEWNSARDATDAEKLTIEARQIIDRVFYRDLLQINREMKSHVTAARVLEEVAEKGLLLSPLARQENEWLSRMTMRELAVMQEAGWLDDMPGDVAEYFEAQGRLDIRYDNTLSHMQEAGKSAAYLNLAQQVGLLAQFDQTVVEDFKREYPLPKVMKELGRIAGVPAAMQATDEERADFDKEKAQAEDTQRLLAAVPVISDAIKDTGIGGPPPQ